MSNSQHALLSASSSSRWLHCTPSARLSEDFSSSTSSYAYEGTKAHHGAERWLKIDFNKTHDTLPDLMQWFKDENYEPDMIDYISQYVEFVKQTAFMYTNPEVYVEMTVDLSDYIPNGFGTVDCAILSTSDRVLHIIDFKYGKGVVVSAVKNTQMLIYALGVLAKIKAFGYTNIVRFTIYQPRVRNFSQYECSVENLQQWARKILVPKAQLAWEGKGDIRAGDWCRFCPAKARCRAYSEHILKTPAELPTEFKHIMNTLSDDEVAQLIDKAREISGYITALEDELKEAIKQHGSIKGYTLTEVKGRRVLTDRCIEALKKLDVEPYEQKTKSITTLEKQYGRKFIDTALEGLWDYTPSSWRLKKVSEVFNDI